MDRQTNEDDMDDMFVYYRDFKKDKSSPVSLPTQQRLSSLCLSFLSFQKGKGDAPVDYSDVRFPD